MAVPSTTIHEIQTGGSNTVCSGCFDPGQTAGMATDGAATVATSTAPVFTSASYNFVAGDVGAWLYIASGTSWIAGWYQIASVATNAATLTATIGSANLINNGGLNTLAGCASVASPTAATWTVDYSRQAAAQFTYTDITELTTSTFTSVAFPFAVNMVGNGLKITGGTNFTVGTYIITSVVAGTATTNTAAATGASVNGAGRLGGSFASLAGTIGATPVAQPGNTIFIKAGTYSNVAAMTLAPAGTAGGRIVAKGYTTNRSTNNTDTGPLITTATSSTNIFNISGNGTTFDNIQFSNTAAVRLGCIVPGGSFANNLPMIWQNCTFDGFSRHWDGSANVGYGTMYFNNCEFKNATVHAFDWTHGPAKMYLTGCYVHTNTGTLFFDPTSTAPMSVVLRNTVIANNSSHVFDIQADLTFTLDCCGSTIYTNAGSFVNGTNSTAGNLIIIRLVDNIVYGQTGWAVNWAGTQASASSLIGELNGNAYGANSSGNFNNFPAGPDDIALTADPMTNGAGGNFIPNTTAGGGASIRALAFPKVLAGQTNHLDIGAIQSSGTSAATTTGAASLA